MLLLVGRGISRGDAGWIVTDECGERGREYAGRTCPGCKKPIGEGNYFHVIRFLSGDQTWHLGCILTPLRREG